MTPIKQRVSDVDYLMKFWNHDRNELDPGAVSAKAELLAYWKCPRCGYAWEAHIRGRFRAGDKCPCCDQRNAVVPGISDFLSMVPLARESYMFDKNEGVDVEKQGLGSIKVVWWKCPYCNNEYEGSFAGRIEKTDDVYRFRRCTKCKRDGYIPKITVADDELLMEYWDSERNSINPRMISKWNTTPAHWKCSKCGHEWDTSPKNRSTTRSGCPCCDSNRVIISGVNDIASILPEILDTFDQSLNPDTDLESVGKRSELPLTFKCKKCGHIWKSTIHNRVRKTPNGRLRLLGCPNCDNNSKRRMTYAEEYPDLAEMYADELNERTLDSITSYESTTLMLKWRCGTCGELFDSRVSAMIDSRKKTTRGCPYCSHTKLRKGESFADLHPDLMDEYDPQNTIDPHDVFPGNKTDVNWVCRTDATHTWKASFAERHAGNGNCPICNRTVLIKGRNTFADVYPELAKLWSDSNERRPDETFYNASLWVKWRCSGCGGEYGAYINDRVRDDFECPYCSDRLVLPGFNSFAVRYPAIAKRWAASNDVDPDNVLHCAVRDARWICPDCGQEYGARTTKMVSGDATCPYCASRRVLPGSNSLKAIYPEIAKMWSQNNELDADHVLPTLASNARWNCPDCGGEYLAGIRDVVEHTADCPYCNNRRVLPGFNSLQKLHPSIAAMWSQNNELDADHVLPTLASNALWNCPDCGGEYSASIREVVEHTADCPYCNNRKVLPGFNSFADKHPDLLKEWDYLNNYLLQKPDEVLDNSTNTAWWICKNDPSHHYPMSIAQRVEMQHRNRESCVYCRGRRVKLRHFA